MMHDFMYRPDMFEFGHGLGFLAGGFALFALVFALWSVAWQGLALWHAARNRQMWWFVALLLIHTAGILDIVYLFFFRNNRETEHVLPWVKKTSAPSTSKKEDSSLPVAESSPAE